MTTVITNNVSRARLRAGRRVRYLPTAAEVSLYGAGPFNAVIANARASGNCDLSIEFPAPLPGYPPLGPVYGPGELIALTDAAPTRHKLNVARGTTGGTFDLFGAS